MTFSIRPARPDDAPAIGKAVVMAVGHEIIADIGQPELVARMFAELAARPDTQYSWANTLVAVDPDDNTIGVAIAYDGALLHSLRRHFFAAVKEHFNRDMSDIDDETDPTEFYLDTLAVLPDCRRQGVGRALIDATFRRAAAINKPLGLLVDKQNDTARKLYTAAGLIPVGQRPFAYVLMDHLQRSS